MREEEKRVHELQALKDIAESLNEATELEGMLQHVLHKLLQAMNLETGWIFFIDRNGQHELAAEAALPPALLIENKKPMCEGRCWCVDKFVDGRLQKASNIMECKRLEDAIDQQWGDTKDITHHATIPLRAGEERFGLLNVASPRKMHFTKEELAFLEAIAFQIGTTIKRIKLVEQERQYILAAERNRLARDLHDSVKQLLFSITLTARGLQGRTTDEEMKGMLSYIGELSQEAMQEMKTLIWQLRPEGLENGLAHALQAYGSMLGIQIHVTIKGVLCLTQSQEETLWRIGQEAFNNCKKHAGCDEAFVTITVDKEKSSVTMTISDQGAGFSVKETQASLGLKSMKERAELTGGTFCIQSVQGKGTTIAVTLPLQKEREQK